MRGRRKAPFTQGGLAKTFDFNWGIVVMRTTSPPSVRTGNTPLHTRPAGLCKRATGRSPALSESQGKNIESRPAETAGLRRYGIKLPD